MQQAEEWKQEDEGTDERIYRLDFLIVAALNDFSEEASFLVIFHPLLPAHGDMSDVLSQGSIPVTPAPPTTRPLLILHDCPA